MEDRLVIQRDGFDLPDLDLGHDSVQYWIDQVAWDRAQITLAEVERRLIEGEDRIEVHRPGGGIAVYEVPTWRRHPIRRLRIALARRSASRSS